MQKTVDKLLRRLSNRRCESDSGFDRFQSSNEYLSIGVFLSLFIAMLACLTEREPHLFSPLRHLLSLRALVP
jgi:hypothetical protein